MFHVLPWFEAGRFVEGGAGGSLGRWAVLVTAFFWLSRPWVLVPVSALALTSWCFLCISVLIFLEHSRWIESFGKTSQEKKQWVLRGERTQWIHSSCWWRRHCVLGSNASRTVGAKGQVELRLLGALAGIKLALTRLLKYLNFEFKIRFKLTSPLFPFFWGFWLFMRQKEGWNQELIPFLPRKQQQQPLKPKDSKGFLPAHSQHHSWGTHVGRVLPKAFPTAHVSLALHAAFPAGAGPASALPGGDGLHRCFTFPRSVALGLPLWVACIPFKIL